MLFKVSSKYEPTCGPPEPAALVLAIISWERFNCEGEICEDSVGYRLFVVIMQSKFFKKGAKKGDEFSEGREHPTDRDPTEVRGV